MITIVKITQQHIELTKKVVQSGVLPKSDKDKRTVARVIRDRMSQYREAADQNDVSSQFKWETLHKLHCEIFSEPYEPRYIV